MKVQEDVLIVKRRSSEKNEMEGETSFIQSMGKVKRWVRSDSAPTGRHQADGQTSSRRRDMDPKEKQKSDGEINDPKEKQKSEVKTNVRRKNESPKNNK